jgi:DNA-directed RNA polymerase II subunit RPB2
MSKLQETYVWKVLESYYRKNSIVCHQIDSYNDFINFGMQEIVDQESNISMGDYTVKFGHISLAPPQVIEEDRTLVSVYPHDARRRDLNYDSAICCDVTETFINSDGNEDTKYTPKVVIGRMPVMLKSSICNLSSLSDDEQVTHGECPNDPGGYFVIKGNERVLVAQMRANYNQVFVLRQKAGDRYKFIAETRSMSSETGHSVLIQCMIGADDRSIHFSLPYVKEPVPVGVVFKALGYTDEQDILNIIGLEESKYTKYIIRDSFFCATKEEALEYIGQFALHIIPSEKERDYAWQVVETELLPHLGITGSIKEQACFLGHIVRKLILTNTGYRNEDDRDNYANKRVEVAGVLMYEIFRNLFKKYIIFIRSQLEKRKQRPDIISIMSRIKSITKGLHQCLATGNWGVQKNASYMRTGVSQILDRMTYCASLSHLRRVIIPVGKEGKNSAMRQLHGSSIFYICPSETPEGQKIGIVLNFALLAKVTKKVPTVIVRRVLDTCRTVISIEDMDMELIKDCSSVFLNSVIIGFTQDPDATLEEIRNFRSIGLIDKEVSVSYDIVDNDVKIFCDEGRFTRPLFALENNQLIIQPQEKYNWKRMIKQGIVQYLDPSEIENSVIAMTQDVLRIQRSDYCEIHPCAMLGIMAAMIPFSDHSQSPRNCYQSSMGKQALGVPALSYNIRTDTMLHVLHYPQRPLVCTKPADILGINEMPSGINAIVAILAYSGFNQEDSVMINYSAVQRGLFCLTSYHTIDACEKKRDTYSFEEISLPPMNSDASIKQGQPGYFRRKNANYSLLDKNGIVKVRTDKGGSVAVKKGDVIIGKVVATGTKTGEETKIDSSVVIQPGEEGIIDRVHITTTPNGYKLVKVVIRVMRSPTLGDKLACYDGETQVATTMGWVPISEVTREHEVASLVSGELVYVKPTDIQEYDHEGNVYHVSNNTVDLKVTPNHRMYVSQNGEEHRMYRADELVSKVAVYKNTVEKWEPNDDDKIAVSQDLSLPLEYWCIFFGIWIANGRAGRDRVRILAYDAHVRDFLEYSMKKMGIPFTYEADFSEGFYFVCKESRVVQFISQYDGKSLPDWCFNVSSKYAKILLDGIFAYERISITTSVKLRDDIQRLCLHAGWRLYYHKAVDDQKAGWEMILSKRSTVPTVNKFRREDAIRKFKGRVYCCTVPTEDGVIFVRRNGKAVWCGNSRAAQKGTIGMIYKQEDMPFTASGITPDIIINPCCIPSRMTINQLIECALGKECTFTGEYADATPFTETSKNVADKMIDRVGNKLEGYGMESHGWEMMYNGMTGEEMEAKIFIGPTYYQRLKHMVDDKMHARATGQITVLTRQPLEGRARDGGLRFGEMERDCMIAHGSARFLKERLFDVSDPFKISICRKCGIVTSSDNECQKCREDQVVACNIPYASKLLFTELNAMGLKTTFRVNKN